MTHFWRRWTELSKTRTPLCVGIDPHPEQLSAWGLSNSAEGAKEFALGVVSALGPHVAAFKPNSAFFEVHGPSGVSALADTLAAIRSASALSILDVKRGDIGSTMTAYAHAYLDPDSELVADAITASPYLGFDALAPAFDLALRHAKAVFVLAKTSNPEATQLQDATLTDGRSVARSVVIRASERNLRANVPFVGLVVGATSQDPEALLEGFTGPILAPGIGAQGARVSHLRGKFGTALPHVIPTSSRGITGVGPDSAAMLAAVRATFAHEF